MTVQPIRDFVVISKHEGPQTTPGGLFIAHVAEEKNVTGTVLAVGSGRLTMSGSVVPLEVVVGDKVVFNKNLAAEVKDGDTTVLVLREDQILCVLK
jgi:Co-chaperonin GroES (HSP10)